MRPKNETRRKLTPLARHIFFRLAFPAGIVFFGCFSITDRVLQNELRKHLTTVIRDREARFQADREKAAETSAKAAAKLAASLGLPNDLARWTVPASRRDAEIRLAEHLRTVLQMAGHEMGSIESASRLPVLALRRDGTTVPAGSFPKVSGASALAGVGPDYYRVQTIPLEKGWLVTATSWWADLASSDATYVLEKGGVAIDAGPGASAALKGAPIPACPEGDAGCDVELGGKRYFLLPLGKQNAGERIVALQAYDSYAAPLVAMTRPLMLAGALFNFFGAVALALFASRALSRPLRAMTSFCEEAEETGQMPDAAIPASRIAEVDSLSRTLSGATQSIQEGKLKLTQAYFQFMGAIVAMLDARDRYTAGHSHRVSAYSEALAKELGLPQHEVDDIRVGALLHDIGKIGVPDEVLRKHERLTPDEFAMMKQHPTIGRNILERVGHFEKYLDAIELHHENLDGSGYPRGLRAQEIPMAARIVKVADVYDALSTDRPYRRQLPKEEVHSILRDGMGSQFDRRLVEIFLTRCLSRFENSKDLQSLHVATGSPSRVVPVSPVP